MKRPSGENCPLLGRSLVSVTATDACAPPVSTAKIPGCAIVLGYHRRRCSPSGDEAMGQLPAGSDTESTIAPPTVQKTALAVELSTVRIRSRDQ